MKTTKVPGFRELFMGLEPEVLFQSTLEKHLIVEGPPERFLALHEEMGLHRLDVLLEKIGEQVLVMPFALPGEGYGGGISVKSSEAKAFFASGMTIWVKNIDKYFPSCKRLQINLAEDLGLPTGESFGVQLWISPPTKGTLPHFDSLDVINIQLSGAKRWRIAPNKEMRFPLRDSQIRPSALDGELESFDLKAGSVLFLPRGFWHTTQALEESYSISIFVPTPNSINFVREIVFHQFRSELEWRRPIPSSKKGSNVYNTSLEHLRQRLKELQTVFAPDKAEDLLKLWRSNAAAARNLDDPDRMPPKYKKENMVKLSVTPNSESNGRLLVVEVTNENRNATEFDLPVEFKEILSWLEKREDVFSINDLKLLVANLAPEIGGHAYDVYFNLKIPKILSVLREAGYLQEIK